MAAMWGGKNLLQSCWFYLWQCKRCAHAGTVNNALNFCFAKTKDSDSNLPRLLVELFVFCSLFAYVLIFYALFYSLFNVLLTFSRHAHFLTSCFIFNVRDLILSSKVVSVFWMLIGQRHADFF